MLVWFPAFFLHFSFADVDTYVVSSQFTPNSPFLGAIQVLRNANGGREGVSDFPEKKRYEGVMFNVISVTSGWVEVQFAEK